MIIGVIIIIFIINNQHDHNNLIIKKRQLDPRGVDREKIKALVLELVQRSCRRLSHDFYDD